MKKSDIIGRNRGREYRGRTHKHMREVTGGETLDSTLNTAQPAIRSERKKNKKENKREILCPKKDYNTWRKDY